MSSFGNAVERWHIKSTGGITALGHHDRGLPVRSIGGLVDSAYSSFSGCSYVPDYQASFQSDNCHLNDEHLSYMDSEYVRAIYNPSTEETYDVCHNVFPEHSSSSVGICGRAVSILGSDHASNVPQISITNLDASVANHNIDHVTLNGTYLDPLVQKQSPQTSNSVSVPDHKVSSRQRSSPSLQEKENQECYPSYYREIQENYFNRSSVHPFKGEISLYDQNVPCCPKNPAEDVSCTYNESQFSGERKPLNRNSNDLSKVNILERSTQCILGRSGTYLSTESHLLQDSNGSDLKSIQGSFKKSVGSQMRRSFKKTLQYGSKGTRSEKAKDLAFSQQHNVQISPCLGNIKTTEPDISEQWDAKTSRITYCGPNENSSSPPLQASDSKNEVLDDTKTFNIRKDATVKPIPLLSQQLEQEKTKNHSFSVLNCEKITKATTPMLYHLAGGTHNSFIGHVNITNCTKQKIKLDSKASEIGDNLSLPQKTDLRPDGSKLPRKKSHAQLANLNNFGDDSSSVNVNASTEECLMNDYREKLKVAQKKVLRETSFKRKDLQMSLPCRLKLNPPKRPSIEHFRSSSSSSQNEEGRFLHTKDSGDSSRKKDEIERPIISRIGGRKRITKEQKQLCFSEPEKLDHLGIQNSRFSWKDESSGSNKTDYNESSGMANKIKSIEGKERTSSTSNLSRVDLKQMQHNALVQYMERKTNQRPNSNPQFEAEWKSAMPKYSEWNFFQTEIKSNEGSQKYFRRRSAGVSSSYDATVTWNDRLEKSFMHTTVDQNTGVQRASYLEHHTLEGNLESVEHSATSVFQKTSKSADLDKVTNESAESPASAISVNFNDRLKVTEDNTTVELGRVSVVKSRGKSMEEIGTTDIIKLAGLSQSSDELYNSKASIKSSRLEYGRTAAAVHQNNPQIATQSEIGNPFRQTHLEGFMGLHPSGSENMAPGRSLETCAFSTYTNNPCVAIPSIVVHTGIPKQSQSMEIGDEVFLSASTAKIGVTSSNYSNHQDDPKKSLPKEENTTVSLTINDHLEDPIINGSALCSEDKKVNLSSIASSDEISEVNTSAESIMETQNLETGEADVDVNDPIGQELNNSHQLSSDQSRKDSTVLPSQSLIYQDKEGKNDETAVQIPERNEQQSNDLGGQEDLSNILKSPEDERREELVREIIAKDKSLLNCLDTLPIGDSAMDLMKSLFIMDIILMEKSRIRALKINNNNLKENITDCANSSKLPSKILLLLQKCSVCNPDSDDLTSNKMELMSSIGFKLEDLYEQKELLLSDISENTIHGRHLESTVKELCKPNEFERYMMFIGDLEKVVSLLFSLSTRLTRVEKALSKVNENTDEDELQCLKERHRLLSNQREDAKDLKANLDRREQVVTGILLKYLSEQQLQDYKHFVRLKTSLLIVQKNLEEKIKSYEEQLENIHNSMAP
ncbi:hypothetical protein GDO86_005445 [Hymenochirus boettgeri]|uniref:Protein Shroom1 n=1 Tax=Hymenochirus boettgeri TaxID=247094 RepID=A0A8T2J9B6_9PIPI|nr:hypothetical protein GDO86_005445 [Hymenochirus boettgeri]